MSDSTATVKPYTWAAAALLSLIAIGHVLRLVFGVEVVIGGMLIPVGVSIPVVVVFGGLAIMLWRESQG